MNEDFDPRDELVKELRDRIERLEEENELLAYEVAQRRLHRALSKKMDEDLIAFYKKVIRTWRITAAIAIIGMIFFMFLALYLASS